MGTRLYVGNLSFNTDEQRLRELFEQNGCTVEDVRIITDRDTGRSRGFGFVEVANGEQAEKAIQNLDGQDFDGRALKVNEARERTESRGGGPRRGPRY